MFHGRLVDCHEVPERLQHVLDAMPSVWPLASRHGLGNMRLTLAHPWRRARTRCRAGCGLPPRQWHTDLLLRAQRCVYRVDSRRSAYRVPFLFRLCRCALCKQVGQSIGGNHQSPHDKGFTPALFAPTHWATKIKPSQPHVHSPCQDPKKLGKKKCRPSHRTMSSLKKTSGA